MATKNTEKLLQFADERFIEGKYQEALHYYTRIIDLDPPNLSDILIKRSMTYLRVGLFDEAMNDGVRTISLQPSRSILIACYICIGRACVQLKKYDTAKKAFRQAVQVEGISPAQRAEVEKDYMSIEKYLQQQSQQQQQQQFSSNQQSVNDDVSMDDNKSLADKLSSSEECADLECPLCYRVFYQPVTLPCGHTFDRACLARVFDYTSKCPLCREVMHVLPDQYPVTVALNNLVQKYFSKEFDQRKQEEQQVSAAPDKNNIPLFLMVDHVLFPLTKLTVHVFEPRYRLMMRRCMSGSRTFGLVTYGNEGGVSKFGTLAKITAYQVLPDGRCLIEAVGDKRFTIQATWEQDGYSCGRVEWFNEEKPGNEDEVKRIYEAAERAQLIVQKMFASVGAQVKQAIEQKIGKMPSASQPEHYSFWLSSLLSLSALSIQDKVNLLKQTNTRKRLEMLMPLAEGIFNYYKQQRILSASPFSQQQQQPQQLPAEGNNQQFTNQQAQSCCLQ